MGSLTNDNGSGAAAQKALWLLIAVALNAAELALPRLPFLPWLKPGLANVITVLWIIKYGCRDAILYTALRIWISGFYFGFSLFTFTLSLCGGMLSTLAMSALWLALGKRGRLGTIGLAIAGALFHNAGQLAAVYFLMAQNLGVLGQIPFMLGASLVFGAIVGALAPMTARGVGFNDAATDGDNIVRDIDTKNLSSAAVSMTDVLVVISAFAVSIGLMFVDDIITLVIAAAFFSLVSSIITKKISALFYPLKFYMLFIFIAATYLFFTYGTRLETLPFITREGLFAFVKQSLRMWCWIETAHVFRRFKFREMFIGMLYRSFPSKRDTLDAGMIALEHFPEMVRFAKSDKKIPLSSILFKPEIVLSGYIAETRRRITAALQR